MSAAAAEVSPVERWCANAAGDEYEGAFIECGSWLMGANLGWGRAFQPPDAGWRLLTPRQGKNVAGAAYFGRLFDGPQPGSIGVGEFNLSDLYMRAEDGGAAATRVLGRDYSFHAVGALVYSAPGTIVSVRRESLDPISNPNPVLIFSGDGWRGCVMPLRIDPNRRLQRLFLP